MVDEPDFFGSYLFVNFEKIIILFYESWFHLFFYLLVEMESLKNFKRLIKIKRHK